MSLVGLTSGAPTSAASKAWRWRGSLLPHRALAEEGTPLREAQRRGASFSGRILVTAGAALLALQGCGGEECGPSSAVVHRVLDGDTVELEGGQLVRYLMIDAPEVGHDEECFGAVAAQANAGLVLGQRVGLRYDVECRDDYDRLLAYVSLGDCEINRLLVERGYACVLHVPPNGERRLDELNLLEAKARALERGLWGACSSKPCR